MGKEWERLQGETPTQYKAFECYLYLEPQDRTVDHAFQVWKELKPEITAENATTRFKTWYREYLWKERAQAYDDHLAAIRRSEYEKGIGKEARKKGINTEKMRAQLADKFELIDGKAKDLIEKALAEGAKEITLSGVASLLRVELDIVRYLATETSDGTDGDPIESMSEDELASRVLRRDAGDGAQESDTSVS